MYGFGGSVIGVLWVASLLCARGANAAEDSSVSSRWVAPLTCPRPHVELPENVRITVRSDRGEWAAQILDVDDANADARLLVGHSCEELTRAVLVTLSLLQPEEERGAGASDAQRDASALGAAPTTEPSLVLQSTTATPDSNVEPQVAAAPARPVVTAPNERPQTVAPSTATQTTMHTGLLLGAVREGGTLWSPAAGIAVGVDIGRTSLLGDLRVSLAEVHTQVQLELQWFGIGFSVCHRFTDEVALLACIGPRLELLRGAALGIARPSPDQTLLPGGAASVALRLPVSKRLAAVLRAEAHGRLRGARFAAEPYGVVYTFPRTGFSLLAGPELQF